MYVPAPVAACGAAATAGTRACLATIEGSLLHRGHSGARVAVCCSADMHAQHLHPALLSVSPVLYRAAGWATRLQRACLALCVQPRSCRLDKRVVMFCGGPSNKQQPLMMFHTTCCLCLCAVPQAGQPGCNTMVTSRLPLEGDIANVWHRTRVQGLRSDAGRCGRPLAVQADASGQFGAQDSWATRGCAASGGR
jgi:hypothetical protein